MVRIAGVLGIIALSIFSAVPLLIACDASEDEEVFWGHSISGSKPHNVATTVGNHLYLTISIPGVRA